MNRFRQLCATTLLAMLLAASSVLAGDLPQGVTSTSPPPAQSSIVGDLPQGVASSSTSSDASVTGHLPQGIASETDPVTELMLSLLQSMLSLF